MATTHNQTPREVATSVLESNRRWLEGDLVTFDEKIEQAVMLGIAAYNDKSNQRPETLSEACARLGINLLWTLGLGTYNVYFGHTTPISSHGTEESTIAELEQLAPIAERGGIPLYVKAGI